MIEVLIQSGTMVYEPVLTEGVTWKTERLGVAGELKFTVVPDGNLSFVEGDGVRLSQDGTALFFGFVFTKKRDKDGLISVTAYDQLRYLKNKDTYVYEGKTATEVLSMIADDFQLQVGTLEDTGYVIPSRVEENTALFDIIQNALDLTLLHSSEIYVLYDQVGKLTLENISSMLIPLVIDEETGENFSYTSTIDGDTYNKIKLSYDNEETGTRDIYIAQDSDTMNQWGILQYFDTLDADENGKVKAELLLELYNKKVRSLSISNAFGDNRIRAGCMLVVQLHLGDMVLDNLMLVEKCTHTFSESVHTMNLNLIGGEFIA